MGLELGLGKAGEEGDGMDWEDGRMGGTLHIYTHECHGRDCSESGKGWKGLGGEVEHIEEPV